MGTLIDFDVFGLTDAVGDPVTHTGTEALEQAMIFFLTSSQGDFLLEPDIGSSLEFMLGKQLSDDQIASLGARLARELDSEFGQVASAIQVNLSADKTLRRFYVDLAYHDDISNTDRGLSFDLERSAKLGTPLETVAIKPEVKAPYVDITYVGENAFKVVMSQIDDVSAPLVFSPTQDRWVWGPYRFPSAWGPADPYFDEVMTAIATKQKAEQES